MSGQATRLKAHIRYNNCHNDTILYKAVYKLLLRTEAVYKIRSCRFQKWEDSLHDERVAATMAISLFVRRCLKL